MDNLIHTRVTRHALLGALLATIAAGAPADPPPDGEWHVTFEDSFDGTELDDSKWSTGFGWGPKSGSFGETTRPENSYLEDGDLVLKMEKGSDFWWSGAVNTKNKFYQQYGYFEARIKIAKGKGFDNAFWSKSNDERWPPEIDFVEILGRETNVAHMTVHYDDGGHKSSGGTWSGTDFSRDYHVFGCLWTDSEIRWYIDGVERRRTSSGTASINSEGQPFYVMLNVHLGGHSWLQEPDASTPSPSYMRVDWVRVWTKGPTGLRRPAATSAGIHGPRTSETLLYGMDGRRVRTHRPGGVAIAVSPRGGTSAVLRGECSATRLRGGKSH